MKIPSSLALECTLKKLPASLTDGTIRKTLSVSAANTKRFVINDHYEFDQKVNHRSGLTVKQNPTGTSAPSAIDMKKKLYC